MSSITIDLAAIDRMAYEPGGGIALAVEETAQAFVEDAKRTLDIPVVFTGYFNAQVGGVFRRFGRSAPNPPPGPPRRRTGDLVNSIRWTRSSLDRAAVYVVSDPSTQAHRHDNRLYSKYLRDQGYKFLSFELPETFH
jgi:hypothetical protein